MNNIQMTYEYIEGNRDPQYGGIITNVCNLPVGATFFVRNGCWTGMICEDENGLYIHIDGCRPYRFKRGDVHLLSINPLEESIEEKTNQLQDEVLIKNVINACSVCKNKDTKKCKECVIHKDTLIPNKFLADMSKITPFFIDSYYELLNEHIELLHNFGFKTKIESLDLGD